MARPPYYCSFYAAFGLCCIVVYLQVSASLHVVSIIAIVIENHEQQATKQY
jgi:hypothetical protein